MTETDLASLKHLTIEDLIKFMENLRQEVAYFKAIGSPESLKKSETWLHYAEHEILERSLGLKEQP